MSNAIVDAAFAKQLAELERLVPQPAGDLGYGSDLSCIADLAENLAEVDPFSTRGIGESVVRRLTTPRGTLPDDRDYGLDLRSFCNRGATAEELREVGGRCSLELAKDDRILSATVAVVQDSSTRSLSVAVLITPADPALNPFSLTFAVTSGAAALEELR
jgi:hypothetical protein